MKKITILSASLLTSVVLNAQIMITSADMPNAGDSVLVSVTNTIGANDVNLTGANYNWDYSTLTRNSQREEKFDSPLTFPTLFAVLFNIINTSYGRENRLLTTPTIPGITISDAYDFLKESTSSLKQVGGGLTVNGTPIPFYYSPNDIIYRFPMNYGNTDSSDYAYNLTIPTIGYYGENGHRVNTVDGWGLLLTPYGTFNTLRVKSVITSVDSFYNSTFSFGTTFPRPARVEYKWLANGKEIPVLEIDGTVNGTNTTITNVQYIDSVHSSSVSVTENTNSETLLTVFPNPSKENVFINYYLHSSSSVKISITDVLGKDTREIINEFQPAGIQIKSINLKELNINKGIYFIALQTNSKREIKKLLVQ